MTNRTDFDTLEMGQSYEEVCTLLGDSTALISSETAQMQPGIIVGTLQSELYEWRYDTGDVIRLLFKQGALNDKVFLTEEEA